MTVVLPPRIRNKTLLCTNWWSPILLKPADGYCCLNDGKKNECSNNGNNNPGLVFLHPGQDILTTKGTSTRCQRMTIFIFSYCFRHSELGYLQVLWIYSGGTKCARLKRIT